MIIHPREHLHEAYPPQVPIRDVHRLTGDLRASNTDAAIAVKEIVMEIGQDYFVPTPSTEDVLYKALEDIKTVIGLAPYRENIGEPALTLLQIYDIIEAAEKHTNKKKNG